MSKLPQLNLRIPPDYHGLIRTIAERLRERDGDKFAYDLNAFLGDREAVPPVDVGALEARVAELEVSLGKVMEMVAAQALAPKSTTKRLTRPKA